MLPIFFIYDLVNSFLCPILVLERSSSSSVWLTFLMEWLKIKTEIKEINQKVLKLGQKQNELNRYLQNFTLLLIDIFQAKNKVTFLCTFLHPLVRREVKGL